MSVDIPKRIKLLWLCPVLWVHVQHSGTNEHVTSFRNGHVPELVVYTTFSTESATGSGNAHTLIFYWCVLHWCWRVESQRFLHDHLQILQLLSCLVERSILDTYAQVTIHTRHCGAREEERELSLTVAQQVRSAITAYSLHKLQDSP